MKLIIAPDSFKGSLSANEVCNIVEKAAKNNFKNIEVIKLPVADGGEGTVDSLKVIGGIEKTIKVNNANGILDNATYLIKDDMAIMEMASASGLPQIKEKNVMKATTYGVGQMINDAVSNGCKTIYLGLGGSATNDGGIGCLNALGIKFYNNEKEVIYPSDFHTITNYKIEKELPNIRIILMSDVKNKLLGDKGATYTYGKQKGATEQNQKDLEKGLTNYINVIEKNINKDIKNIEGSGAAGGLGAGLLSFFDCSIQSGVDTVLDILEFNKHLENTDLVITGEGMMDYQSAYGKVAYGVATRCMKENIPCIAIVGSIGENAEQMYQYGITSIFAIVNKIMSLDDAFKNSEKLCFDAADRIFKTIKIGGLK